MSKLLERELRVSDVSESAGLVEAGVSGGVKGSADFLGGDARSREPMLRRTDGGD